MAVVGLVGGPGLIMERAAEEVDGVALEAESDVGEDCGGDADVGLAEEFLDHDEFGALFQKQGRSRVPAVVEADAAEAGLRPGSVGVFNSRIVGFGRVADW